MNNRIILILLLLININILPQDDTTVSSAADSISAGKVLADYINAIGGKEKLESITDRTTVMTGTVQGFDVKMTVYQKAPNLLRQEIEASGLDQVIIFNGSEGLMKIGGDIQHITGQELQRLKNEATLNLVLNPDSAGIKLIFSGKTDLGDAAAYKIHSSEDSTGWDTYYNVETGLKLLEEKEVKTATGTFLQKIWYSDYKEVDGIKFPFTIRQQLGAQEIDFKVHSVKLNQGLKDDLFTLE